MAKAVKYADVHLTKRQAKIILKALHSYAQTNPEEEFTAIDGINELLVEEFKFDLAAIQDEVC